MSGVQVISWTYNMSENAKFSIYSIYIVNITCLHSENGYGVQKCLTGPVAWASIFYKFNHLCTLQGQRSLLRLCYYYYYHIASLYLYICLRLVVNLCIFVVV